MIILNLIGFGDLISQKPGPIKPNIDKRKAKNVNKVLFLNLTTLQL